MLVAARGLDQVAAGRKGEVIPGHQHAVGRGAVEQLLACSDCRLAVDIEGGLPIRMPREDGRMLRGIAEHQERLIAGMDGEHRVAWRVARRRQRHDTRRHFRPRLETRDVIGDIGKDAPLVAEGEFQIRRRRVQVGVVHPERPFRRRHHDLGIGKDQVIVLVLDAIGLQLVAGIAIAVGWHARLGAAALGLFCLATAILFHTNFANRNELLHFEKDLAIAGGMFVLMFRGTGGYSVEAYAKPKEGDNRWQWPFRTF
jgi:uncharacterized membrane protein YphA (DoxX/SURF4 family)